MLEWKYYYCWIHSDQISEFQDSRTLQYTTMILPYTWRNPTKFALIKSKDSGFPLSSVSRMQSLWVSIQRFQCSLTPIFHLGILIPFAISRSFESLSVIHPSELLFGMFGWLNWFSCWNHFVSHSSDTILHSIKWVSNWPPCELELNAHSESYTLMWFSPRIVSDHIDWHNFSVSLEQYLQFSFQLNP